MAYEKVNAAWPEGTNDGRSIKPTEQEAISAARRLYRFAMKKTFRGKAVVATGNRYTTIRYGVMRVNPDFRGGGWHELVHTMSHYCAWRLYPKAKGHGPQHLWLEKEMTEYVVASGWLEGKLALAPKPPVAAAEVKRARVEAQLKRWRSKQKRAETAIRKLERRIRAQEKSRQLSLAA